MHDDTACLPTFERLCDYVRQELCDRDALDPSVTPFVRTKLLRAGKPWGFVFHVEGPRSLRTSAVWSEPEERIVFYGSTGERTKSVALSESPSIEVDYAKAA